MTIRGIATKFVDRIFVYVYDFLRILQEILLSFQIWKFFVWFQIRQIKLFRFENRNKKMSSIPGKGKQATKGQKQIFDENQSTIRFYFIMAVGGTVRCI